MSELSEAGLWVRIAFMIPGLVLLGISKWWKDHPPKKINWFYGYRTLRSMKNQTLWDAAQQYAGRQMWSVGLVQLAIGVVQMLFLNDKVIWLSFAVLPFVIFVLIYTERYLKRVEEAMNKKLPIPEE